MTPTNTTKQDFISTTTTTTSAKPSSSVTKPPKAKKTYETKRLGDQKPEDRNVKVAVFGAGGTGKTFQATGWLELGYTVLNIVTEFGGSGSSTIQLWAKKNNISKEVLDRYVEVIANTHEEFNDILDNYKEIFKDYLDVDKVVVFHEGASNWQTVMLGEEIDESVYSVDDNKERQQYWGAVRRNTLESQNHFFAMRGNKSLWNFVVLMHEDEKEVGQGDAKKIVISPLITGGAKKVTNSAFDIAVQTVVNVNKANNNKTYKYNVNPDVAKHFIKDRGFEVPDKILNDVKPKEFVEFLLKQRGIIN